jgi:hypothetical protein
LLSLNFSFKLVACYHPIFPVVLNCKTAKMNL